MDLGVVTEQHHADLGLVEVHGEAVHVVGELYHLAGHHLVEAVHACDTVAKRDDSADLIHLNLLVVVLNLLAEQRCYLVRIDLCHCVPLSQILRWNPGSGGQAFTSLFFNWSNWVRSDPS